MVVGDVGGKGRQLAGEVEGGFELCGEVACEAGRGVLDGVGEWYRVGGTSWKTGRAGRGGGKALRVWSVAASASRWGWL